MQIIKYLTLLLTFYDETKLRGLHGSSMAILRFRDGSIFLRCFLQQLTWPTWLGNLSSVADLWRVKKKPSEWYRRSKKGRGTSAYGPPSFLKSLIRLIVLVEVAFLEGAVRIPNKKTCLLWNMRTIFFLMTLVLVCKKDVEQPRFQLVSPEKWSSHQIGIVFLGSFSWSLVFLFS